MTTLRSPEQRDFLSRLHHPRVASRIGAWLGTWLGIRFFVCFVTGVLSHGVQDPNSWPPSRPIPYRARADNTTLLDRDNPAGWLVVALTLLAVVVGVLVSDRRGGRRTCGPGAGGR